jgi:hypothetical protein
MEATCSSETSVVFQWTTRRYIPEDRILHNHRSETLQLFTELHCRQQKEYECAMKAIKLLVSFSVRPEKPRYKLTQNLGNIMRYLHVLAEREISPYIHL